VAALELTDKFLMHDDILYEYCSEQAGSAAV